MKICVLVKEVPDAAVEKKLNPSLREILQPEVDNPIKTSVIATRWRPIDSSTLPGITDRPTRPHALYRQRPYAGFLAADGRNSVLPA